MVYLWSAFADWLRWRVSEMKDTHEILRLRPRMGIACIVRRLSRTSQHAIAGPGRNRLGFAGFSPSIAFPALQSKDQNCIASRTSTATAQPRREMVRGIRPVHLDGRDARQVEFSGSTSQNPVPALSLRNGRPDNAWITNPLRKPVTHRCSALSSCSVRIDTIRS